MICFHFQLKSQRTSTNRWVRVKDNEVKTEERWRKEQERQLGIRHEQEHSGLMIWFKKCWKEKTGVTTEYSVQQHVFFFTPAEPSESIAYTRSLGMKKAGVGISVCKILNDWNKYFHKLKHTHTHWDALTCTRTLKFLHMFSERGQSAEKSLTSQNTRNGFILNIFF